MPSPQHCVLVVDDDFVVRMALFKMSLLFSLAESNYFEIESQAAK